MEQSTERFRPADRVRRRVDYRMAQAQGRRVHTPHFVLMVQTNEGLGSRLGITVTRKTHARAVARNRIKRVVREVFRRNRALFPDNCDVVFVAKRGAEKIDYALLLGHLRTLKRRQGTL